MEFVNSVHQCTAIIEDCPDILRAVVSIQVEAFDCAKLYRTLFTTRCSTYNRFGDYLIDRLSPCLLLLFHRSSSPSQVARHTGSSPPMQSHRTILGASANSSSWRNYQASWACPCDTVVRGTIVGGGGIDPMITRQWLSLHMALLELLDILGPPSPVPHMYLGQLECSVYHWAS